MGRERHGLFPGQLGRAVDVAGLNKRADAFNSQWLWAERRENDVTADGLAMGVEIDAYCCEK